MYLMYVPVERTFLWVLWIAASSVMCQSGDEAVLTTPNNRSIPLHIGGIFPMEGAWAGGVGCLPAARMAFRHINDETNLLPGYNLTLHNFDSKCKPGRGTNALYKLLYQEPKKILLLGAGCSTVSTRVAEAARMWNLIVLSYGSSSPALSNRDRFPTFFRTHPSATVHNPTRVRLFKDWEWTQIATIQETQEVFTSTIEDLEKRVKTAGIEIAMRQSFLTNPANAVRNLKRQDARIIVGVFYENMARRVFCEVYKEKLYGPKYVWFIIGWYPDNWYTVQDDKINCTAEQLKEALEGHLTTEVMMLNPDDSPTISGRTSQQFLKEFKTKIPDPNVSGYPEAPLAYDAVWSLALALDKTMKRLAKKGMKLEDYNYDETIAAEIYKAMNETDFFGVSGPVAFSATGDRLAWTQIEQMINGTYHKVGFYGSRSDNLTWVRPVKWIGGSPPADQTLVKEQLNVISMNLYAAMCALASLAIIAAVASLTFNIWFRKTRYIQLSHPSLNNLIIVGCIVCLSCVFLLGLDGKFVSPDVYPVICQLNAWVLCIGFSLAYGAMFSKVWRVHRLSTNEKASESDDKKRRTDSKKNTKKEVEDWHLYIVVVIFILVDVVICSVWTVLDPQYRSIQELQKIEPVGKEDVEILPLLEYCDSRQSAVWLGVIFGAKGLLLIFGLFLAYETRNMSVKELNDSRFVGMSIYNVVVLCIITAPVTLIIRTQQNATFAFVSLAIIFCCVVTLVLIFIPKVVEIKRNPRGCDNSTLTGAAMPTKEDEERQQRLATENEDIKKQIAEREGRIRELNNLLSTRMQNKPSSSLHLRAPSPERSRHSLGATLTPPVDVVEDSAIVVTSTSISVPVTINRSYRNSAGSDEEFSESYI
ncbi:GABA b receptor precursor [Saccoglossus kowalevskii]|uniref:GABA b receptor n=1 Tax=Saccoglossus kowalevskii TaxID=10224 RepID=D2XMS7_SACKO|nr:GABA b receptor precursor [Saccoglossus kowalevskii]ADB22414.1 GABA b receptor [Saccoglossus kowalevskii]